MEILGPAQPAPTKAQLIAQLTKPLQKVISGEMSDESDVDRVWILRKLYKNILYYRDLAYFAPALYQGLVDATGIAGAVIPDDAWGASGWYDWTQNVYKGYCRKLEAVLGTRIPNAIAVPNDPSDEADLKAARAANNAAMYVREHCDLQVQILWLVFSLFNFGTSFWNLEWVVDPDKNGYKAVESPVPDEDLSLGGGYECPECRSPQYGDSAPSQCPECGADMSQAAYLPPSTVSAPGTPSVKQIPRGSLEIEILDGTEISVPLDADGRIGIPDCQWVRRERERHKSVLLAKYNGKNGTVNLRQLLKTSNTAENAFEQTNSLQYGESVRSAMGSPIGVVRPKRENRWTVIEEDWQPRMYEMVDDDGIRQLLYDNFPLGLRITSVKGIIVDLENRKPVGHWQECQPEPTKRIMTEPLGDDWVTCQDILNNLLNQASETIERSNEPGFADPTRVDLDAYQRRRSEPLDLIPAVRPPGGQLSDLIYRPNPPQFSEQIPPFKQAVEQTGQQISGLLEIIWGGDTTDPTARQSELKTNAAIRQLSVIWVLIGKSLERVYEKSCAILAENEDGILAFSKAKKNQFGKFDSVSVVIADLKGGNYHFEADEAIPMTWGQQRDLLMWMLDKPQAILEAWGLSDPLNIAEFKELIGMPGMRVPKLDERDKAMDVISQLLEGKPQPGQPDPQTGQPGPPQPSIAPDWEDDADFMGKLVKAYLILNYELKKENPDGYQNTVLYAQACQKMAQAPPPPPPPPKASVAVSLKGADIGNQAITEALQKVGIEPPGVQTQIQPPPPKNGVPAPMPSGATSPSPSPSLLPGSGSATVQ